MHQSYQFECDIDEGQYMLVGQTGWWNWILCSGRQPGLCIALWRVELERIPAVFQAISTESQTGYCDTIYARRRSACEPASILADLGCFRKILSSGTPAQAAYKISNYCFRCAIMLNQTLVHYNLLWRIVYRIFWPFPAISPEVMWL